MATLSKNNLSASHKKAKSHEFDGREQAERRRIKPRKFLQNAFEAMESDLSGLYQTALSSFYHAQRRRDRAHS